MKQTILQREEHVYNTVMKNKANFTRAEITATERYIYSARNEQKASYEWSPANSEIFKGCLDE